MTKLASIFLKPHLHTPNIGLVLGLEAWGFELFIYTRYSTKQVGEI